MATSKKFKIGENTMAVIILPLVAAGLSVASLLGGLFGLVVFVQLFFWVIIKISPEIKNKFLWFLAIMVLPEFLLAIRLTFALPGNSAVWMFFFMYLGILGFFELMMSGET